MMPKKERRAALFSSLTVRAKEKAIFGLEDFGLKEPKTSAVAKTLSKLPEAKKYLFVLPKGDQVSRKSVANIPHVNTVWANYLNPYDVLHAEKICFVGEALQQAEDTFVNPKKDA